MKLSKVDNDESGNAKDDLLLPLATIILSLIVQKIIGVFLIVVNLAFTSNGESSAKNVMIKLGEMRL